MPEEKPRYTMIQPPELPRRGKYNVLVAGRGAGKTSFVRLTLDAGVDISLDVHPEQLASVAAFVQASHGSHTRDFRSVTVDVQPQLKPTPEPVTLTFIDTPSLSFRPEDAASDQQLVNEMLRMCSERFAAGRVEEQNGEDHIHLCLYFLCPDTIVPVPTVHTRGRSDSFSNQDGHPESSTGVARPSLPTLPVADVNIIRSLSAQANVLPVIACADTLSNDRLAAIKAAVRRDLAHSGIGFGIFDVDTPGPASPTTPPSKLPSLKLPYALVSPDLYSHSDGVYELRHLKTQELITQYTPSKSKSVANIPRNTYVRSYRWGDVDALNPEHTDFTALCSAVFGHMQTLKDYTKDYLYRKFCETEYDRFAGRSAQSPAGLSRHSRPLLAIDTSPTSLPGSSHRRGSISLGGGRSNGVDNMISARTPTSAQSSSGHRIKKITVACQFCRSRKLKCSGERPACAQCIKRSNSCDYLPHRRRGSTKQRKSGDESDSEGSAEEYERASLSPVVPVISLSRRNSNVERNALDRQPNLERRGSLVDRRNSIIERGSPPFPHMAELPPIKANNLSGSRAMFGKDNELPSISTLALPDASHSSRMTAPPPPLIRPETEHQAVQRRRAATGITRFPSVAGPKTQACNFCRTRKTKCDGASPQCSSCARRNLNCDYAAPHQGKKGGRRASTSTVTMSASTTASVPMASAPSQSKASPESVVVLPGPPTASLSVSASPPTSHTPPDMGPRPQSSDSSKEGYAVPKRPFNEAETEMLPNKKMRMATMVET